MKLYLAHTQGFCAGVSYALAIVEMALVKYGTPIYVRHHIVHNTAIINDLTQRGVVFTEDLAQVPTGSIVIFSAHGVAPEIYQEAQSLGLKVIDATCPLVNKIHKKAQEFNDKGIPVILIGHKKHQEIIGTSGYIDKKLLYLIESIADLDSLKDLDFNQAVAYLTQTTLSVSETASLIEALRSMLTGLISPKEKDICYATEHRQQSVIELAHECDLIIICGSSNSSNSVRLYETALKQGVQAVLIDNANELDLTLLQKYDKIGISSGASVPEIIVTELVQKIISFFPATEIIRKPSIEKKIAFKLPNI